MSTSPPHLFDAPAPPVWFLPVLVSLLFFVGIIGTVWAHRGNSDDHAFYRLNAQAMALADPAILARAKTATDQAERAGLIAKWSPKKLQRQLAYPRHSNVPLQDPLVRAFDDAFMPRARMSVLLAQLTILIAGLASACLALRLLGPWHLAVFAMALLAAAGVSSLLLRDAVPFIPYRIHVWSIGAGRCTLTVLWTTGLLALTWIWAFRQPRRWLLLPFTLLAAGMATNLAQGAIFLTLCVCALAIAVPLATTLQEQRGRWLVLGLALLAFIGGCVAWYVFLGARLPPGRVRFSLLGLWWLVAALTLAWWVLSRARSRGQEESRWALLVTVFFLAAAIPPCIERTLVLSEVQQAWDSLLLFGFSEAPRRSIGMAQILALLLLAWSAWPWLRLQVRWLPWAGLTLGLLTLAISGTQMLRSYGGPTGLRTALGDPKLGEVRLDSLPSGSEAKDYGWDTWFLHATANELLQLRESHDGTHR